MSVFLNDFSKEVYELTYKLNNETIDETFRRVAKAVASVEKDPDYWEDQFFNLLQDFKFVPGGRILSNAGTNITGTTLINCFVDGFDGEDRDSMNSIMDALKRQAMILKSEGGYGFNVGTLRPKGAYIEGIANETPGAVKMLEMWDKQSEVITQGSGQVSKKDGAKKKIRKGAQLVCLPVTHPDIEEFITAKQTSGRLAKFNMSVGITDDFMDAVINHKPWTLEFPDYEYIHDARYIGFSPDPPQAFKEWNEGGFNNSKEIYKKYWDGNLKKWKLQGLPTKIYKQYDDANELWDLIMKSTYNRNEPGVLFLDTINKMNNLWYCEYIDATNPCVVGDTLVLTNLGWIKIKNLNKYKKSNIKIITRDKDGKLYNSELQWSGITTKNDELYRVNFDNGEFMLTNKKHKFYDSDFNEKTILELNESDDIIGGIGIIKILNIEKINKTEDVYDLTSTPNYNFFSILNRTEIIIDDDIIINDNIRFKYFDIVNTKTCQKFAYQLEENEEII